MDVYQASFIMVHMGIHGSECYCRATELGSTWETRVVEVLSQTVKNLGKNYYK